MKRIILLLVATIVSFCGLHAQATAFDGTVEYQKGLNLRTAMIELPYAENVITDAIKDNMSKRGYKPQSAGKEFIVFRGVQLGNDTEPGDLYFKVDRKSRKEKEASVIHLIVGRSSENLAVRTPEDNYKSDEAKEFLNNLVPSIAAYQLELSIKQQDEVVKKAEKKLKGLQDDQRDYEKKISNLQDKLSKNKSDQEAQTTELNKQRSVLDAMQSRRTTAQ